MLVGYARTSTAEPITGMDAQERDLKAVGAEELFPRAAWPRPPPASGRIFIQD
jgi:hypothetical protein